MFRVSAVVAPLAGAEPITQPWPSRGAAYYALLVIILATMLNFLDAQVFGMMAQRIKIDLNLTDGYVDLVGQGQDLAIRYGELADSTLRVKRLADNRRVVCASRAYLKKSGRLQHPDDLVHHECVLMRFGLAIDRDWPFLIDGKVRRVVVQGHRIANDGGLVRDWCLNGYGVARKSFWDVEADLKAGTLVELLQEFSAGGTGLQIVYPATQDQPKRVRLLIDRIAEAFAIGLRTHNREASSAAAASEPQQGQKAEMT